MKKIIAVLSAFLILCFSFSAYAANPAVIQANDAGTAWDMIVVRKPETKNSATIKKTYGITGTGKNGVSVSYYKFNGSTYSAIKNSNGEIAQTKVGSAGVFYKQVNLSEGHNKFAVRAEHPNGLYQVVYFDINVLNQQIINNVTGFSNGIQSLYNGWMN